MREQVINKMWECIHYKEIILRQKSRNRWIQEGDLNKKFFHNLIKQRERRNHISFVVNQAGVKLVGWRRSKGKFKDSLS